MSAERPWKDRWKHVKSLGGGAQGHTDFVSSIPDPNLNGVLKTLRSPRSTTARGRFLREVASLKSLAVEGLKVPAILDDNMADFDKDAQLFFVMDFISGSNLEVEVGLRGPILFDKASALVMAIADTVSSAHERGVIHRDLKPNNIVVRDYDTNDVVIVDFGLSFNDTDERLTETNEQMRSKFLAVPEMNTPGGDRRDHRTDMTAVCAILYFCLTGHCPGQLRDSGGRVVHRSPGASVREFIGNDPRCHHVEMFLDKGLAWEPENRFQTWESLRKRLEAATHGQLLVADDPKMTARDATKWLRQHDPVTRKFYHGSSCGKMMSLIMSYAGGHRDSFGWNFIVSVGGLEHPVNKQVPSGMEPATDVQAIFVQLQPHEIVCRIHYAVCSEGMQSVLIRFFSMYPKASESQILWETEWEPVHYFDPDSPPPIGQMTPVIDHDMSQAIRTLQAHMASKLSVKV